MEIQLITSEDFIKSLLPISQNLAGEYLATAMFEAQEIGLKSILGTKLLAKLKEYEPMTTGVPAAYVTLKENCQLYLAYRAICELLPKVAFKIANAGVVSVSDDKVSNVSPEQINALINDYEAKSDYFALELQQYLADNLANYPELTANQASQIRSNLYSSASCGIWLGGPRDNCEL